VVGMGPGSLLGVWPHYTSGTWTLRQGLDGRSSSSSSSSRSSSNRI
jgi:hypothetical protein